jgi:hypothetical protein
LNGSASRDGSIYLLRALGVFYTRNTYQNGHDRGKRNQRFPRLHLQNPDDLEIDEEIRIAGGTPPLPTERELKSRQGERRGLARRLV